MSELLVFVASSSLLALMQSLIVGQLTGWISAQALLGAMVLAVGLRESRQEEWSAGFRPWPYSKLWILTISVGGAFQFLYLLYEVQGSYFVGNPNNLGDLPLHINFIKVFAKGLHFWPQNPEFAGESLRYPFGMDLFNALFEVIGISTRAHLVLVGLLMLGLAIGLLLRLGGEWLLLAFFLSGGFVSWQGLVQGTGWLPGSEIDWKNLFLAVFVTQRGFLFALPAGLWLIGKLEQQKLSKREKIQVSLIWGALAFFHLHSYLFLSLFLGLRLIIQRRLSSLFGVVLAAFALGLPLVLQMLMGGENLTHALGWSWGWTYSAAEQQGDSFLIYFMRNFGSWIAVLPILFWLMIRPLAKDNQESGQGQDSKQLRFELALLFVLGFFFFNFRVAPWAWDNIKVLLWVYLLFHLYFCRHFLSRISSSWQMLLALCFFYPGIIQFFSSYPSAGRAAKLTPPVLSAECQMSAIKVNEVVVSRGDFDHALLFQGTLLALGYEGHVWSHGYDLNKRKEQVTKILKNEEGWDLAARELKAAWIVRTPGAGEEEPKAGEKLDCGLILTPIDTTK